jgi:adenylate cyclase
MPLWEAGQILLGVAIPYQLGAHIIATRGLYQIHGVDDTYVHELDLLWPGEAWLQTLTLLAVWVHAVIGIHFWLRMEPWYARVFLPLFALAVFVPVVAVAGWITAAREVALFYEVPPMTPAQYAWGNSAVNGGKTLFFAVVFSLAAALLGPKLISRIRRRITVEYPGNVKVRVNPGATLLEISRMNDIPHASVCGGRARCSTCRVRVTSGADRLAGAESAETTVLTRIRADEGTRLACQIRPRDDIAVQPLVPARDANLRPGRVRDAYHWGVEQPVAILFADIRNFTGLSETRLPFDVVFLLNRYCSLMAAAIERQGGYVDKFIGDGVMAIFGISNGVRAGSEAALRAAAEMGAALDALNEEFAETLGGRLRIGVGIHAGPAILGRIGTFGGGRDGRVQGITALGDTVNAASRLESATKTLGAVCVASTQVLRAGGYSYPAEALREISVKGREKALKVIAFESFDDLGAALAARPAKTRAEQADEAASA